MDKHQEGLLEQEWDLLLDRMEEMIGKRPADLHGVLFLIGVRELGKGIQQFTKEQKQDLMHIAICKVLSLAGFYELEGLDEQGWPHWRLVKKLPPFDLLQQENFLKIHVLEYFHSEV